MTRRNETIREFVADPNAPLFARRLAEKMETLPADDGRRIFLTALFRDRGEAVFVEMMAILLEIRNNPDRMNTARRCLKRILDNKYASLRDFRALSRHVAALRRMGPTRTTQPSKGPSRRRANGANSANTGDDDDQTTLESLAARALADEV